MMKDTQKTYSQETGTVEIEANLEADVVDAAEGCPTEAIKVQDSPFN